MAMMASASLFWLLQCLCLLMWHEGSAAAFTSKVKRDFAVTGLEELEPSFESFQGEMFAGVLPIAHPAAQDEEGEYMFWLFQPASPAVHDSLVIWFNGGPGYDFERPFLQNKKRG